MDGKPPQAAGPDSHLSRISTLWPLIGDLPRFSLCYGRAIRKYIQSIVRNADDAEEVVQEFLLHVLQRGFPGANPERGRFRDYLKAVVRNAVFAWLGRNKRSAQRHSGLSGVEVAEVSLSAADSEWVAEWRACILERAWQELESRQRNGDGNQFYTVLRLAADCSEEASATLAAQVRLPGGRTMRADLFRKQLSRARRLFAELIAREVAATLQEPSWDRVEEELIEVGLMPYVKGHLPARPPFAPSAPPKG